MKKKRAGKIQTICANPEDAWVQERMRIVNSKKRS